MDPKRKNYRDKSRKLSCVELSISETFMLRSDISETFLWNYSFSLYFLKKKTSV